MTTYNYKPHLGEIPTFDVPTNLGLSNIASDVEWFGNCSFNFLSFSFLFFSFSFFCQKLTFF